jgi:23S rRNA pseudouridine2605 synthase
MEEERVQKILAKAGFGSRRACEVFIRDGKVNINGIPAHLGSKADEEKDTITVNGVTLKRKDPLLYIAVNKPRNILSDEDPNDPRESVRNLVPVSTRLFTVGRLDYDSEGLILLTNDGELANRLTHPRYGHEKEYRVLVITKPDAQQLEIWRRGVVLPDGFRTAAAKVEIDSPAGKGTWMRVILKEGHKRQIREVGRTIGLPVSRILRVRIGTLLLGNLKPGEWRYLTQIEIMKLKEGSGLNRRSRRK